jgi:hypothetical protein
MIRPGCAIAFCFGLALAWCGTAEAQPLRYCSDVIHGGAPDPNGNGIGILCTPDDAAKVEIDDLRDRVKELEGLLKALLSFLPEYSGEPPEHLPCIEKREVE